MERYKAKAPSQNRNRNNPTPLNAAATYSRMIRRPPPPPPQRAVYNRHVNDDVAMYRRHVDDDVAATGGVYHEAEVWGPCRNSYKSQVLNRSSPQITQRPLVIRDQNYYSTKFAPANSDWSPLDDGIEINPTFTASRENYIACVDFDLYGPSQRKRLPVFANICPK